MAQRSDPDPSSHLAPPPWAGATVYAMRAIPTEGDGRPGEGLRAGAIGSGVWTVREIDTRAIPGARAPRCLVFESQSVVRRLWDFPSAWMTLPAVQLRGLAAVAL